MPVSSSSEGSSTSQRASSGPARVKPRKKVQSDVRLRESTAKPETQMMTAAPRSFDIQKPRGEGLFQRRLTDQSTASCKPSEPSRRETTPRTVVATLLWRIGYQ